MLEFIFEEAIVNGEDGNPVTIDMDKVEQELEHAPELVLKEKIYTQ